MHVQSTFIITVTAVVTNTKHTRTRSGPSVSRFLSSARRRRATRRPPRARPSLARLRASAPERPSARTPRRVPKRRARRDGRCRRHTARRDDGSSSRSRIQSTNERKNAIRVVASPHRARATRKRREGERRRVRRVSSAPHDERTSGRAVEATTSDAARGGGESGPRGEWVAW